VPELTSRRPLILVADPNPETTVLIERRLEWACYGVVTAACGEEAIELVEEKRPDAAIVEVELRDMTGYDFVRHVRAQPESRLMALTLMSERAGKLDREFAFTVGADEYLRKPFPSAIIVPSLTRLLGETAQREERLRPRRLRRVRIARSLPRRSVERREAAELTVLAR
jgi:CheY-like chemotaxis protein